MSIMPNIKESALWQQVKNGLEDADTHLCRLENSAGSGVPDVNACSHGVETWLELKMFHSNDLHFRNSQRAWISRRLAVGGRVFIVARKDDQLLVYRAASVLAALFTQHPPERKSFHVRGADLPTPLHSCRKPFKWAEVRQAIFGP